MERISVINQLENNGTVIHSQLKELPPSVHTWKKDEKTWCLLEIICHLFDEEREDFRYRIQHIMRTPDIDLPRLDPLKWIEDHQYMKQNFELKVSDFIDEREKSIKWLRDNVAGKWDNVYRHKTLGDLTPDFFLSNWLAHDFIHIRQINRTIYNYYASLSPHDLDYAGNW